MMSPTTGPALRAPNLTAVAPARRRPLIVTIVPDGPPVGVKLVILGSSSRTVSTAVLGLPSTAVPVGVLRARCTVSSGSYSALLMIGIVKVFGDTSAAAQLRVPEAAV